MSESTAKRNIQKLQRAIVDGLEDVKAQDIRVFDTGTLSPLFERVIIASGTSNRQTKALSASVRDKVREAGFPKPRIEGEDNGEWIIVDCGAAVAHIMQPTIRSYYNLEEIWGGTPVRLKLGAAKPAQPKPAGDSARGGKAVKSAPAAQPTKGAKAAKPGEARTARSTAAAKTTRTAAAGTGTVSRKRASAADAPVSRPRKSSAAATSQEKPRNPSAKRSGVASKKVVKTVVVGQTRKPAAKPAGQAAKPAAKAAGQAPARKSAAAPARKLAGQ
ncbi:ribosome silencing factor [Tibeticola sp.]|uniref:ribosome silencing factor n=1 Tax=Tibeticola sp. TaxID=2005368 RepID=UPI0025F0FFB5|nr:ribosome silencing factor [Tibeticola sp.]